MSLISLLTNISSYGCLFLRFAKQLSHMACSVQGPFTAVCKKTTLLTTQAAARHGNIREMLQKRTSAPKQQAREYTGRLKSLRFHF